MTWLVTGGAGYIGSHVVVAMRAADEDVVVLGDLSSGVPTPVGDVPLVLADGETVTRRVPKHGVRGADPAAVAAVLGVRRHRHGGDGRARVLGDRGGGSRSAGVPCGLAAAAVCLAALR